MSPNCCAEGETLRRRNEEQIVEISVEDLSGRCIYHSQGLVAAGGNSIELVWNAANISSGVYLFRAKLGKEVLIEKLVKT